MTGPGRDDRAWPCLTGPGRAAADMILLYMLSEWVARILGIKILEHCLHFLEAQQTWAESSKG